MSTGQDDLMQLNLWPRMQTHLTRKGGVFPGTVRPCGRGRLSRNGPKVREKWEDPEALAFRSRNGNACRTSTPPGVASICRVDPVHSGTTSAGPRRLHGSTPTAL